MLWEKNIRISSWKIGHEVFHKFWGKDVEKFLREAHNSRILHAFIITVYFRAKNINDIIVLYENRLRNWVSGDLPLKNQNYQQSTGHCSRKARNKAHLQTPLFQDLDGESFLERIVDTWDFERRSNHAKLRVPMREMQKKIFLGLVSKESRGGKI